MMIQNNNVLISNKYDILEITDMTFFYELALDLLHCIVDRNTVDIEAEFSERSRIINPQLPVVDFFKKRRNILKKFIDDFKLLQKDALNDDDYVFNNIFVLIQNLSEQMEKIEKSLHPNTWNKCFNADDSGRILHCLSSIKRECIAINTWNVIYNNLDPLQLFQYMLIAHIILDMVHLISADQIRETINCTNILYSLITQDAISIKFDLIKSTLNQMLIEFIPLRKFSKYELFFRSTSRHKIFDIKYIIGATLNHLEELRVTLGVSETHIANYSLELVFNDNQKQSNSTNQKRYESLEPDEKLLLLGYKRAVLNPDWICSITQVLVDDPVSSKISPKGMYERKALIEWVAKNGTDPKTREKMTSAQIVSMPKIKDEINNFLTLQEKIKYYFDHCLESGMTEQRESMALVPHYSMNRF